MNPKRPASVPESATWFGGADGGVFAIIERRADDSPYVYRAKIYDDWEGGLWYEGFLMQHPAEGPEIDPTRTADLSSWDGHAVRLVDGRKLAIAKP